MDLKRKCIYENSGLVSFLFCHMNIVTQFHMFSRSYILPLLIGCISATLRWITDFTCSSWSQTCKVGSEVLHHVYQVVFFFIIIIAATKAKQISQAFDRLKKALEVMADSSGNNAKKKTE